MYSDNQEKLRELIDDYEGMIDKDSMPDLWMQLVDYSRSIVNIMA